MKKNDIKKESLPPIEVIDLFCGIGGLSFGMKSRGFNILAGYDLDATCQYAYETNNEAKFIYKDIKAVSPDEIRTIYGKGSIRVLAGCAPCQPFSSYAFKNKKKDPNKYDLLYEFGRIVKGIHPDIVTMENVAQILSFKEKPVLTDFENLLKNEGYHVWVRPVYCPDYGIPQTRKRLVLLASRLGDIELIKPTHKPNEYKTVKETIGDLPEIKAGETDKNDPMHRAKALSSLNLERLHHTPYGGSWKDWPEYLRLR